MRNWLGIALDVRNLVVATDNARAIALTAAQAAADKLGRDIVLLDVSDEVVITDIFMVVSAPNERQVQAIVDAVEEQLRKVHDVKPVRREGVRGSRWVLLDYADLVVHVQHTEEREYYALDSLWKDCPAIEFVDKTGPDAAAAKSDGRQDAA